VQFIVHQNIADEYKTLFDKTNSRFIIGGNFNAKHTHWGLRLITTKGRESYKAVADTGCEIISTGKPTLWPTGPKTFRVHLISLLSKIFQQTKLKLKKVLA
jgi:hypothetical protein